MTRMILSLMILACAGLAPVHSTLAETIAIVGTGNVGSALGLRFTEIGHTVIYGARDPDRADVQALVTETGTGATAALPREAAQEADIIVLAVPWDAVEEITRGLGDVSGRIIIDPTNPRSIADDGLRDFAFDDSNAERIQAVAPGAYVVKAFNSLGDYTMRDPDVAGGPVSIPIAGDSADAKRVVAALVRDIGLHPVDVGPLRYAHAIEGLHYLRYNAGQFEEARINFYMPADVADPN